jgi:hypothetical protein
MELKEFIKQTIIQITDGMLEGDKYVKENNFGSGVDDSRGKEINFDVAVTSNEEEKTGVAGKISVANILSFGGNGENVNKASNVSRIQFKLILHVKAKKNK